MSFVTSHVATFNNEIDTWSGLGKSGVGETGRNGIQTGLAMLKSLAVLFLSPHHGIFLPGLLSFIVIIFPVYVCSLGGILFRIEHTHTRHILLVPLLIKEVLRWSLGLCLRQMLGPLSPYPVPSVSPLPRRLRRT